MAHCTTSLRLVPCFAIPFSTEGASGSRCLQVLHELILGSARGLAAGNVVDAREVLWSMAANTQGLTFLETRTA